MQLGGLRHAIQLLQLLRCTCQKSAAAWLFSPLVPLCCHASQQQAFSYQQLPSSELLTSAVLLQQSVQRSTVHKPLLCTSSALVCQWRMLLLAR